MLFRTTFFARKLCMSITAEQHAKLAFLSRACRTSMSALLRDAIDDLDGLALRAGADLNPYTPTAGQMPDPPTAS